MAMNVSLTPELEAFVGDKVKSGLYNSASEVVRESLRLLRRQEQIEQLQLEELRKEVQIGIDQIEAGKTITAKQMRERLAQKRAKKA
jgi:antitoxin ParD1/3/4